MRRAIVVGLAIALSVSAVVISRSLFVAKRAVPPQTQASGPGEWRLYRSRQLGFALRYPETWFLTPLGECGEFIGVIATNAADPFGFKKRHPCSWPPSTFTPRGAAVLIYVFFGGRPRGFQTWPPDTPVPLTMKMLDVTEGPRGYGRATFHHVDRYSIEVWAGRDATQQDRRTSRLVLGSIRPWMPPRADPRFGECVGGWRRERVPTGPIQAGIGRIDAVSATDVWSVGSYLQTLPGNGSPSPDAPGPPLISTPMVLHRLVTKWQLIPAVDPTLKPFGRGFYSSQSRLADVAVVSDDDVWVVGGDGRSGLIERWDGRAWTVTPSPAVNLFDGVLRGVAASGPDDAWAVGTVSGEGKENPIVEHWDGKRWTVSPIPGFGRFTESFDVSAASTTDAWVVGKHWNLALALHWNGKQWRSVHTPWARSASLFGVVDLGPSNAWAVGTSARDINGRKPWHAMVEHWDGERWTLVDTTAAEGQQTLGDLRQRVNEHLGRRLGFERRRHAEANRPALRRDPMEFGACSSIGA